LFQARLGSVAAQVYDLWEISPLVGEVVEV